MRRYTALFFFIMFMIGTDTFLISPLLPTLQKQFGVSTGIAGWMLGAYTLGSALFALIAGPLSDGWNRRTVLLSGLLGFSVSTILCGFADSFWTMCLFRFLAGVSAAFTAPQVWASIPVIMPASRVSKTMGIAFAGLAASQALGVPIGSWLAVAHWSVPFWTIGIASLLLIAVAFYSLPDMKPSTYERTSILRRYVPLIMSGKARSGFIAYLLLHLGSGTAFAFIGKWMADRFELPIGQIGTVMMFLGFGTLLGSIISSNVTRRLGNTNAIVVGMLMLMVLYTVMPHLTNLRFVTIIYLIIFATLGIIFPMVMGALTSLNASIRGTISSLANSTMNSANTLGAWIAGLLYVQFGGYSSIGIFSAVCLALSLGMFLFGDVLGRKAEHSGQESASAS
ncbi:MULTISPECIES: MFS transporter [unclassified Paenibacillus]|uniref:MFS transporter n=1 Tax=unclassified Paenibacillus TaxID=185978 RepID=UPI00070B27E2|nr:MULTISPECIES: MFS transporter [unclassified Paenibacillus]KQX68199.1 MFS transporter [Paenibacillus sp. Root444D2]KRE48939.1 MFS transporter [Paenibacillus sp. Soil724D2]